MRNCVKGLQHEEGREPLGLGNVEEKQQWNGNSPRSLSPLEDSNGSGGSAELIPFQSWLRKPAFAAVARSGSPHNK